MLKKSKTKFSYARRILALPLLFTLTFMYLVNAKNKEIIETNLEIAQQISEIKKDTITSNISVEKSIQKDKKSISKPKKETNLADKNSIPSEEIAFGTNGTKLYQENPKLFLSNDTIKIENVTDSSEFQQKIKEAKEKQSLIIIKADKIVYTDYSNKKKSSVVNPQISVDNPQIFIDGRSITKEEMDKISPDLIESVYINKKNDNENNYNEIRIFTKK